MQNVGKPHPAEVFGRFVAAAFAAILLTD